MVNYQTKENAQTKNLTYVQDDGTFVMKVDDSTWLASGGYRDSCVAHFPHHLPKHTNPPLI